EVGQPLARAAKERPLGVDDLAGKRGHVEEGFGRQEHSVAKSRNLIGGLCWGGGTGGMLLQAISMEGPRLGKSRLPRRCDLAFRVIGTTGMVEAGCRNGRHREDALRMSDQHQGHSPSGSQGGPKAGAPARPASTVVILRDGRDGIEVFMVVR